MTGGEPAAPTRRAASELPFTSAHTSSANPSASARQRRAGAASKPEGPGASRRAVRNVSEASVSIGAPGTGQARAGTPENGGPPTARQPLSSELKSSPAGETGGGRRGGSMRRSLGTALVLGGMTGLGAACGGGGGTTNPPPPPPPPPPAPVIAMATPSGNAQSAPTGSVLPNPLRVIVSR